MTLRKWQFKDVLKISELEKECFPGEPWSYAQLVSSFQSETFYGILAEDGDEIVGYGGITIAADSADIENIAVTESYRRSGIGGELLKALLTKAKKKGVKTAFLEVRVSNAVAMRLYLKNGFKGAYARSRYYTDGEDCLVMKKEL